MNKTQTKSSSLSKAAQRLFLAYAELRKEKPANKISVVELCKKAEVNRSTFYRNSNDVFELERKIEEYCVNSAINYLCSIDYRHYSNEYKSETGDFQFPVFEDKLALKIFQNLGREKFLYKSLFNRLLLEAPFLAFEKDRKKLKLLKIALSFIMNGAFLYCSNFPEETAKEKFDSLLPIVFHSYKAFYDKIINEESLDPLPISTEESLLIPEKRERLNVKKTKRNLQKAFLELLEAHPIDKISVSELCTKAEICNSTFYTHYNGIENYIISLLEETIDGYIVIADALHDNREEEVLKLKDLISYSEETKEVLTAFAAEKNCKEVFDCQKELMTHAFNYVNEDYDCKFDSENSFSFVCYCSWGLLFDPFFEHEFSSKSIFRLTLFIFLNLFERKSKTN
ncbi:MAG: hypothetical protein Q4D20_02085 [Clostridia bacterium]|nr:hypothetical protein [Clostridia bacterium]